MRRTAVFRSQQQASNLIEKVTARVFCQLEGRGGNPVTIFSSSCGNNDNPTTTSTINPIQQPSTQVRLAQSCEWESVMVDESNRTMAFYMPTGEQVSFCAHAAMGGAIQLAKETEERFTFSTTKLEDNKNGGSGGGSSQQQQILDQEFSAIVHENDIVSLEMSTICWSIDRIQHPPVLHRLLRDALGLQSADLVPLKATTTATATSTTSIIDFPTFQSVDVVGDGRSGRPKTIVYVNSMQALQEKCHVPSSADAFRQACDALDPPSTGLYLYSPSIDEDGAWECRQFPRASGYPEDPATGIAAACLAVALRMGGSSSSNSNNNASNNGIILPHYKFYQGTAMGKPSLIMVDDLQIENGDDIDKDDDDDDDDGMAKVKRLSYRLLGRIEIDDQEEINVNDFS